jgi:hypothetical protein
MPPTPYDLIYSDDCTNQQFVRCYNRHYFRIVKAEEDYRLTKTRQRHILIR